MAPRLKEKYEKEVVPALVKEFKYTNGMAVPRLRKIVLNMGLGEAIQNPSCWTPALRSWVRLPGKSRSSRGRGNR